MGNSNGGRKMCMREHLLSYVAIECNREEKKTDALWKIAQSWGGVADWGEK